MNIKNILSIPRDIYNLNRKRDVIVRDNITYVNWWLDPNTKDWFADFLNERLGIHDKKVVLYSVFGPAQELTKNIDGIKIFYSGENLESRIKHEGLKENKAKAFPLDNRVSQYNKILTHSDVDLVLTFSSDIKGNALRFPYWIIPHFAHCYSIDDVRNRLNTIEEHYHLTDLSRKDAAVICSHDFFGTRTNICDSLNNYIDISYAGKWRNNTDALWSECSNNKKEYLSRFRFNICPENMDAKDYVTEKIWDSFDAGCIPIYGGALGNPEPEIFNRDAFVQWSFGDNNEENIQEIIRLSLDDNYYRLKKNRRIFRDEAVEYIFSIINSFENRMEVLFGHVNE